jgi:hypothetical protein
MLKRKAILQMLSNDVSQSKICQEVRCSKRMVSDVKKKANDTKLSHGELLQLSDSELQNIFLPDKSVETEDARKGLVY